MLINEYDAVNIEICGEKIITVAKKSKSAGIDNFQINFKEVFSFPGLINSHDHLDFNCFAPLGQKIYTSYTEWGNHIHETYKENIKAVLKIPQHLRTSWGMYKNLLAGVTTVINHGDTLQIENPLINIYQGSQNLHSVKFQKNWRWKLNNPFLKDKVCVIHTGEGTDKQSAAEIDELLKWNLLNRKLVGVHAVAMDYQQAKKFSALVWCPESNQILLDKHADITQLIKNASVVFGTDSTLTGNWNIWEHLRLARTLKKVKDDELFQMITSAAARLWGMNNGELQAGKDADIVIAKTKNGHAAWNDLFSVNPSDILLVLHKGKIRMFDKTLSSQITSHIDVNRFSQVNIDGATKLVEGNLPALIKGIKQYNADVILPVDAYETNKDAGND